MSAQVKRYFDYKNSYAFLAMQPAFELEEKRDVEVRWIPYWLRLKGRASAASRGPAHALPASHSGIY